MFYAIGSTYHVPSQLTLAAFKKRKFYTSLMRHAHSQNDQSDAVKRASLTSHYVTDMTSRHSYETRTQHQEREDSEEGRENSISVTQETAHCRP